MVRDPARRAAKYAGKVDPDAIRSRFSALKEEMEEQVALLQQELATVENTVKQILADEGISTVFYPMYLSFGKELYGISRKHTGGTKTLEGDICYAKWKARGLTGTVLKSIGTALGFDVSNWTTP